MIYNSINKNEYDNMCPESEKTIVIVNKSPWLNSETLQKEREKRRYEKRNGLGLRQMRHGWTIV